MSPARGITDPNVLLLSGLSEAPQSAEVREDFVKQAMYQLAQRRGLRRLGRVFLCADYNTLRGLLLVLGHMDNLDHLDGGGDWHDKEIKTIFSCEDGAAIDATFLRIAELATDVIQWEGEDNRRSVENEFEIYTLPAWPVFTDEVEFELEGLDLVVVDNGEYSGPLSRVHTRAELLVMQREK